MTLEEAIDTQLGLGYGDPVEVARQLEKLHGVDWIVGQLAERREEIVAGIARTRINGRRNSALSGGRSSRRRGVGGRSRSARDPRMDVSKWVPEVGYVKFGDLTATHCTAIAGHYRMLVRVNGQWAEFYETCASMLESHHARTIAALAKKTTLPDFPVEAEVLAA